MTIAKTAIDSVYAYRFIRLMSKDFNQWKAFEFGLIDDKGNLLKRPKTNEEKDAYTPFHASIRSLKRTLSTVPGAVGWASMQSTLSAIGSRYGLTESDWKNISDNVGGVISEMIAGDAGNGSGSAQSIATGTTTGDVVTAGPTVIPAKKRKRKLVGKML